MKKCGYCKKNLDIILFNPSPSKRSRDGLMANCSACVEKANKSYHKNSNRPKKGYCSICAEREVFRQATFGLILDKRKTRCSVHKTEEMVDLRHLKYGCIVCEVEGIFKRASFGLRSDRKQTHCSAHKTEDMVDITNFKKGCIICAKRGIRKIANFGLLADGKATHCIAHKITEMVDLAHFKDGCVVCTEQGTFKRASFGFIVDKKATHCVAHKTKKMINLVDVNRGCIVCAEQGICKRASFGLLGKKKTHCTIHKSTGMIDLVHSKNGCILCAKKGIFKRGSFGLLTDKKITHCTTHKTSEMIDLNNLKKGCITCAEDGVFKIATFGLPTNKKRISCLIHKTDEMIDLAHSNASCVVCADQSVFKRAGFGRLFEPKTHCKVHSKPNEYSKNNPKCEKCFEKPFYGDEKLDQIPARCEVHKKESDVDMISRICENCKDEHFIPTTQTKCHGCLGWIVRKEYNRGIKEIRVWNCLTQLSKIMGTPKPTHDKQVATGCRSKRRPDFYYPEFTDMFSLIVEVDEHQHSKYSCGIQGELIRMVTLFEEDSGGFPLLFIRFNPDPYYYNGKEVNAYRGREEKLCEVIKGLKNRESIDFYIGVIYLFYDGYDKVKIEPLEYETMDGEIRITHKHPLVSKNEHVYKVSDLR